MPDENQNTTLAAIDLGSNSFHMIVANMVDGNIVVVDRIRDSVRLAAGLDENRNITAEASDRALECLRQFGQRIQGLPDDAVSAVGTNVTNFSIGDRVAVDPNNYCGECDYCLKGNINFCQIPVSRLSHL
jgi:hypothetical protein